jgi:AraC-like DNA-binding protein
MAMGQQLLLAIIFLKARPRLPAQWLVSLILISGMAYCAISTPLLAETLGRATPIALAFAFATPYLLVEFAIAVFEFRSLPITLRAGIYFLPFAAWVAIMFDAPAEVAGPINTAHHIGGLLLIAHAALFIYLGRDDDLLETRRRYRTWFVLLIATQTIVVMSAELIFGFNAMPAWLALATTTTNILLIVGLSLPLLSIDGRILWRTAAQSPQTIRSSPANTVLRTALSDAMDSGLYQTSNLGIRDLAAELNTSEHQLRKLINRQLGYRNFSAFLNQHRVNEAKRRLVNPEFVRRPILTIAMDLGYGSIGPFNRAFREATGLSPSEYRRQGIRPQTPNLDRA